MTETSAFDPYHTWLGIHPSEQPADFYRLLGICRFESNTEVIRAAYAQRVAYLSTMAGTAFESTACRVAKELESAQGILLSPAMKSSYDATLARVSLPPSPPQEVAHHQVAIDILDATPYETAATVSRRNKPVPRSHLNGILGHVGGGIAGLVAGYLILCVLVPDLDQLGLFHSRNTMAQIAPTQDRAPTAAARPYPSQTLEPRPNKPAAPTEIAPSPQSTSVSEQPTDPTPPLKPRIKRLEVPERIVLPKIRDDVALPLAVAVSDSLEISINNPSGNPHGYEVQRLAGTADQWAIIRDGDTVANLVWQQDDLVFHWAKTAVDADECLRNVTLKFATESESKSIVLRAAAEVRQATLLDFAHPETTFPLNVELWGFNPVKLRTEILGFGAQNELIAKYDPVAQVGANQTIRALMGDRLPYGVLEIRLLADTRALRIRPLMRLLDGHEEPWTETQLKSREKTLDADTKRAAERLQEAEEKVKDLERQITYLSEVEALVLKKPLKNAYIELEQAKKTLPILQNIPKPLKQMDALYYQVSKIAKLRWRVFFLTPDKVEVDLLRVE